MAVFASYIIIYNINRKLEKEHDVNYLMNCINQ